MNQPQREWPEVKLGRWRAGDQFVVVEDADDVVNWSDKWVTERYLPASQLDALREALRDAVKAADIILGNGMPADPEADERLERARAVLTQLEERKQ